MKKFKTSELVFIVIGFILMVSATLFLKYNISLVRYFSFQPEMGDPFAAAYYESSTLPNAPATPPKPESIAQ